MGRRLLVTGVLAGLIVVSTVTTPKAATTSPEWVRTGGPIGGLGYDVRMRPDDPDTMLVTDAWAGMFMSTDGGTTWFPTNEGITTRTGPTGDAIPVFSVTVDPSDPDIVWAGTQDVRGIFKSVDSGHTWAEHDNGVTERDGITFRGFTVDPHDSDVVWAAAEISSWAGGRPPRTGRGFDLVEGVVYRTTNGGADWTAVWRGDNLARYIWIDPTNSDTVYVSTGIFDREAANSDPQSGFPGGEGILKTTDGGSTWTHANNGLPNLYIGSLFMHPDNPQVLLAAAASNVYHDGTGVYLSTDGAATWEPVLIDSTEEPEGFHSVEFSIADPEIAYAASSNRVFRSEDSGRSWTAMTPPGTTWGEPPVRGGFPIDLQVDTRDANRVFINAYGGGNFLSTDGGRTWIVASTGYTGAQTRALAVDPDHAGRVWVTGRSGLFVSTDGGSTWTGQSPFDPYPTFEGMALAIAGDGSLLEADNVERGVAYGNGQEWRYAQPDWPYPQAVRSYRVLTVESGDRLRRNRGILHSELLRRFSPRWRRSPIRRRREDLATGQRWRLRVGSRHRPSGRSARPFPALCRLGRYRPPPLARRWCHVAGGERPLRHPGVCRSRQPGRSGHHPCRITGHPAQRGRWGQLESIGERRRPRVNVRGLRVRSSRSRHCLRRGHRERRLSIGRRRADVGGDQQRTANAGRERPGGLTRRETSVRRD